MSARAQATATEVRLPIFRCRSCGIPAVRYMGGKRRTFYCAQHGPGRLADWTRLLPIPEQEYELAGRVVSLAPPLPARVTRLIDGLVDGLREVLAQDLPAASVPDMDRVKALEAENARLAAELQRVRRELDAAEEIALEALELRPEPATTPPDPEPAPGRTEQDFPPADTEPKPRAPDEEPSFPVPVPALTPEPERRGQGYVITAPRPKPAPGTATVAPAGLQLHRDSAPLDLDMFGLDVLIQHVPAGPNAPGLTATRRALKDFAALSTHNKQAVLDALKYLSVSPEAVRETKLTGTGLYALRATRKLRIVCQKAGRTYHIDRIVDRSDKQFYRSER